jgi:hypothetical protein
MHMSAIGYKGFFRHLFANSKCDTYSPYHYLMQDFDAFQLDILQL